MKIKNLLGQVLLPKTVYAHCDIPCGIYDPHAAQLAALTIMRMIDLITDNENIHDVSRYVMVKEEHAEKCKHEVRILYGDYFQVEHFQKYPNLRNLIHRIMELASQARQNNDRDNALELLEAIGDMAKIFWETKDIATKQVKSPYKVEEKIVVPEL